MVRTHPTVPAFLAPACSARLSTVSFQKSAALQALRRPPSSGESIYAQNSLKPMPAAPLRFLSPHRRDLQRGPCEAFPGDFSMPCGKPTGFAGRAIAGLLPSAARVRSSICVTRCSAPIVPAFKPITGLKVLQPSSPEYRGQRGRPSKSTPAADSRPLSLPSRAFHRRPRCPAGI